MHKSQNHRKITAQSPKDKIAVFAIPLFYMMIIKKGLKNNFLCIV
jgi:hypothetical protein